MKKRKNIVLDVRNLLMEVTEKIFDNVYCENAEFSLIFIDRRLNGKTYLCLLLKCIIFCV